MVPPSDAARPAAARSAARRSGAGRSGASWPAPYDAAAAARLVERFAALGPAEARLAARPDAVTVLKAIGGNSPFLSDLVLREASSLRALLTRGPEPVVEGAMAALAATPLASPRPLVAAALRQAKRIVALSVAFADIGGIWPLGRVTEALSDLAQASLRLAVAHLLCAAGAAGTIAPADPEHPAEASGLVVLGMGKLGARELNYSSDIDLIIIYDPGSPIYTPDARDETRSDLAARVTSRLARDLVTLMEARDADGYVFRTDLRLRPDPAATPPAIALPAAIAYYESMGQNWERAAMTKARPVAGDLAAGQAFLEAIRPFVWRRGLDFALIADIHAIKRRIDAHRSDTRRSASPRNDAGRTAGAAADPAARLAGFNVKLGQGGIREIEFLAQTLALVWGGRDPTLRQPTTLGALQALAEAGLLSRPAESELAEAYRFLRAVEHRLQMVADRQVHALSARPEELAAFATFMGYPDVASFAGALSHRLDRVRAHYVAVFERIPDPLGAASRVGEIDLSGDDPAPAETIAKLAGLGFAEPARILAALRGWQAGRVRALRSERARELMARLLPALLDALARQPQPDAAFARCDQLLARLPAGVPILSLFERNPALIERIAAILGAAPSLAEHLAGHPAAIDGLLAVDEHPAAPARLLRTRLADATRLEDAIAITRRSVREEDFAISAATLEARIDADMAGLRRSALADAALSALLAPVLNDFASRYGRVRGGAMAVAVLGKAGGQEMMAGSDLDLMLFYDHPEAVTESWRGPRKLPAGQYFIRAAHAYVAALTAPGADGQMYAIDMRLRPSGNKGPVAVSLAGFRRYHTEAAWTWERMALTRARVVAGPPALRARVAAAIAAAMAAAGPPARIRADAASMRARLAHDLPPAGPWDVKLRAGGMVDVEFIAQALQLIAAAAGRLDLCHPTTRQALRRLQAGGLLSAADAAALLRADRLWRSVQGMLRITLGRVQPAILPEASVRALLRAVGPRAPLDLPALCASLDATASDVRAIFVRLIGEVRS
jgi:glutamate-ammonia-ligase adenylyltransferase